MDLPDFLHEQDGEIRLIGSRIGLFHLVREYHNGLSAEMVALEFPTVSVYLAKQVFEFYLANRAAVDDYMRAYQAELDRHEATAHRVDWDKLRARMAATRNGPAGGG